MSDIVPVGAAWDGSVGDIEPDGDVWEGAFGDMELVVAPGAAISPPGAPLAGALWAKAVDVNEAAASAVVKNR